MSNVALLRPEVLAAVAETAGAATSTIALGPAVVEALHPTGPEVRLEDQRCVRARLALQLPYEARVGDELLVISSVSGHYVIGVLRGAGNTRVEVQGDLDVRAHGGTLRLGADRGVQLDAPEVRVQASRLSVFADTVLQKVNSLHQRITELWSVHAGQSRTIVEGSAQTQARSATILTEETVSVNGKAIYLG